MDHNARGQDRQAAHVDSGRCLDAAGVEKAGKFVFVVENGKAKRVPVTTGFDDGAFTEITEGLLGSELVVVTGRDTLTPNASVTTSQWLLPVKKAEKQ